MDDPILELVGVDLSEADIEKLIIGMFEQSVHRIMSTMPPGRAGEMIARYHVEDESETLGLDGYHLAQIAMPYVLENVPPQRVYRWAQKFLAPLGVDMKEVDELIDEFEKSLSEKPIQEVLRDSGR